MSSSELRLGHAYGCSYRGSGGASGAVWGVNCAVTGREDTGFLVGVRAVTPERPGEPGAVWASGSDCIGDGREWREGHIWDPASSGWRSASFTAARDFGRSLLGLGPDTTANPSPRLR